MSERDVSLHESEARYRELVNHLHSGVVVYEATAGGRDFFIRDFNPAAARIESTTPQAVIGRLVTEAFPGVEEFGLLEVLRRVWRTGTPEHHPITLYRDDRLSGWRENYVYRLPSGLVVAVYEDVTERKQAEQALAERSHFLEQLLEAIPVPVFYKGTNLRYVGCNQAFAEAVERSKDDIIGATVFDIYPTAVARHFDASDRKLLAHPQRSQEYEESVPAADGDSRSVLTHKAVFSDVDGTPAGIVGVNLDVTEIRQAQQELAASAIQLRLTLKAAVSALAATTEMRDPYTAGHQRRVAELAVAIAGELGWQEERIETLRTAALLHDIGKVVVPAEILSKPGRLTEIEISLIRNHARAGAETVADIDFEGGIADMILQHHERLDGSGYPAALRGAEILPEARVMAVADVVEAMVSHRPYRAALPVESALAELEDGAGVRYDDAVCAACIRLFREKGFAFAGTTSDG